MKHKAKEIKHKVRQEYAKIVKENTSCCCDPSSSCCGSSLVSNISKNIGYTDKDLSSIPEGANLGLGCGNPVAPALLKKGETVLDLGSGAGFDCFLAGNRVGKNGKIIGIDMTPEMIDKARENAKKNNYKNVEFRLGEIENLPVTDNSVDIVISNCVINLSPDKKKVFSEIYRVLKSSGRLMISDIVLTKKLPDVIRKSVEAYVGCLSGAMMKDKYIKIVKETGFKNIEIINERFFPVANMLNDPSVKTIAKNLKLSNGLIKSISNTVLSIQLYAVKPWKIKDND